MKILSIIFIHYSTDDFKSKVGEINLKRLKDTLDDTVQLIVVNNGEKDEYFKNYADIYIKSDFNCLGRARNSGYDKSEGRYVCFIDNDIEVNQGWWQECISLLEKYPDRKFIASPVYTTRHFPKYTIGEIDGNILNRRSGSPCLVMRRESFEEIGRFLEFPSDSYYSGATGTKFCNTQNKLGYLVILTKQGLAKHVSPKGCYKYNKK